MTKEELDLEERRLKIKREDRKSRVREILTYLAFGGAFALSLFIVIFGMLHPEQELHEIGIAAWTFIIGSAGTAFGHWWSKRERESKDI